MLYKWKKLSDKTLGQTKIFADPKLDGELIGFNYGQANTHTQARDPHFQQESRNEWHFFGYNG